MAENWTKKGEPKIQLVTDHRPVESWIAIKDFDWPVTQFAVASIGSDQLILLFHEGSPLDLKEKVLAVNKLPKGDGKLISYRYVKYIKLGFTPTEHAARDVSCAICEKWDVATPGRPLTYPAPDTGWHIERWIKALKDGSP